VGDAEFQKKCLGKMKDVAGEGRTVLFVSHNMEAVANLCKRVLLIENGEITLNSTPENAITKYLSKYCQTKSKIVFSDIPELDRHGDKRIGELLELCILDKDENPKNTFECNEVIQFKIKFKTNYECDNIEVGIAISNNKGQRLHHLVSSWYLGSIHLKPGKHEIIAKTDEIKLYPGEYRLSIWLRDIFQQSSTDFIESFCMLYVNRNSKQIFQQLKSFSINGGVFLDTKWIVKC
jgi:lipopolysaccharide transport system ATP-binding protein